METINNLANRLAAGPNLLTETLKDIPREIWGWKPSPGRWSVNEIIIHLADAETVGYTRIRRALAESGSNVFAYDQDAWAVNLTYSKQDTTRAIQLFSLLRLFTADLLRMQTPDCVSRKIVHPEHGILFLEEVVQLYIDHVDIHCRQIRTNLEAFRKQNPAG